MKGILKSLFNIFTIIYLTENYKIVFYLCISIYDIKQHAVFVFGVLTERVSERRSRTRVSDIGLDLHINVIGRIN